MKHLRFIIYSAFICLSIFSCHKTETTHSDEYVNEWINATIDSVITENEVRALSIAINRDGQPPYTVTFGQTIKDSTNNLNEFSIYPVAMLSKTFTGIIVNSLIDEEKLDYEEPISTYLADVLTDQGLKSCQNIPLKNLLHHTSGLSDNDIPYYNDGIEKGTTFIEYTSDELLSDLNKISITSDEHIFEYSNFGYSIVGYICEKISGKPYSQLLKEYVTDKYDLPNTVVHLSEQQKDLFISHFQPGDGLAIPNKKDISYSSEGVYSNIIDLSTLQSIQSKSYQNYFERAISNSLILTERSVRTRIDNWKYGIGYMQIANENNKYFGYHRNSKDYASVYLFSTYPNVGITILTTEGGPWLQELALDILDGLVDGNKIQQPQKRSLAWTMFSVIDTDGIESGIDWYFRHKDSKRYDHIESEINTIGYRLLREGNVKESIEIFKLNVSQFPASSNVYDSLGEAYAADGNTELAIQNYQKSLDMDPENSRAVRVLKRLRAGE